MQLAKWAIAIAFSALGTTASASLLSLTGTFTGFFVSGTPYSVLTGSWTASVDTSTLTDANGSIQVRPSSIVIDQAQTFVPPGPSSFSTTWTTSNTFVEVYFTNSAPSGVVQVHGDPAGTFDSGFTNNFNDFQMYYSDGFIKLAAREPLQSFSYALTGMGSYYAGLNIPNTVANGSVELAETIAVGSGSGPIDFLGGTDAVTGAGLSIDFGNSSGLQVTVNPAPSVSAADLFIFNTFSTSLQGWQIDVEGTLVEDALLYIPYASGADPYALKLFHFDDELGVWELISTTVDTTNQWLVASMGSFSPTMVLEMDDLNALEALRLLNATQEMPEPYSVALAALALALLAAQRRARSPRRS